MVTIVLVIITVAIVMVVASLYFNFVNEKMNFKSAKTFWILILIALVLFAIFWMYQDFFYQMIQFMRAFPYKILSAVLS